MKPLVLQRINELIDSYKLSKNAFANKINMEQTTVNNQLIGKRSVSIDLILNILLAFPEISSEWLLRGKGNMLIEGSKDNAEKLREFTVIVDKDGYLKLKQ
jgi:plasmid maintenance system antidote protein VapI